MSNAQNFTYSLFICHHSTVPYLSLQQNDENNPRTNLCHYGGYSPPLITTLAPVSSGRSLLDSSWLKNWDNPVLYSPAGAASMLVLPPSSGAGSKLVPRTVTTFTGSFDFNVKIALPENKINTHM